MRGDNIEPVPPWVHWDKTWTAADPLIVPESCDHHWVTMDGPTYCEKCGADTYRAPHFSYTRDRSRDVVLVCVAGMAIIAILAWLLGRAAG